MKLEFCSLNSGSNGNTSYVAAGNTRLLIDAGLPGRSIVGMLEQIKVLPETINGILVTHEHSDHVKGVGVLSRKFHIPIYANEATWQAMKRTVGEVPPHLRRVFETESDFMVGDIGVFPIPISHDTVEPVAFRLYAGNRSVAVATDMGRVSKQTLRYLSGTDLILLESNHDPEMLRHNERYPEQLKRRIMGTRGHLSNMSCAETLLHLQGTGVRQALLGHLSEDNNTPELAMQTVLEEMIRQGVKPGRDIRLEMAWRNRVGGYFSIE